MGAGFRSLLRLPLSQEGESEAREEGAWETAAEGQEGIRSGSSKALGESIYMVTWLKLHNL